MTTLRIAAAVTVCFALAGMQTAAASGPASSPDVTVREMDGTYSVAARFDVPQGTGVSRAVLADYEQIPRFMPDVRTSVILQRTPGRLMVEQEAISQLMMFSKKIHLVLEITEDSDRIAFVDRCGKSFIRYEGEWRLEPGDHGTTITYALIAQPAFDVPGFLLKRLLKRDSGATIARLRAEIASRDVR